MLSCSYRLNGNKMGFSFLSKEKSVWHILLCSTCLDLLPLSILRLRENGRHIDDNNFKCIFLNWDIQFSIRISLKFVSNGPINNIPTLVQIMAGCRPGEEPLYGPIMIIFLTNKWVTRPQRVNTISSLWLHDVVSYIAMLNTHLLYYVINM